MEVVKYKHSANSGDLIHALPGVKRAYEGTGKKAVIYQRLNMLAAYYQGAEHPIRDTNGKMVTMNPKQWQMLKPLLLAQEYIQEVAEFEGQEVDVNLDRLREGEFSTMGYGSITRWQFYTHPYLATDELHNPWLSVPKNEGLTIIGEDHVIVNFTSRYRNDLITYYWLKEWENKLIFAGLPEEHEEFCIKNKLNIPRLIVDNFLELAQAIQACKFVLCNQSMVWAIAEGLKKKRVLEVCRAASNCVPHGPGGFDYLHEDAAKFYVNKFMKG